MKNFFLYFSRIILVLLLLIPNILNAKSPGKDCLITLNGTKLTGSIKSVNFSNDKSEVLFENDFGNSYTIQPATIFGFTFQKEGETLFYESKCLKGKWRFLKTEKKGKALSLYTSSERQLKFTKANEPPIVVEEKNPQAWLQFAGEQPLKVYRFNYKRVLRKRMGAYPELAKMIGKRGFRYNNLSEIVDLYNKLYNKSKQY